MPAQLLRIDIENNPCPCCKVVLHEIGENAWLPEKFAFIIQKTKLTEAIRFALSRWEA